MKKKPIKRKRPARKQHAVLVSTAVHDGLYLLVTEHTNKLCIGRGEQFFIIELPKKS